MNEPQPTGPVTTTDALNQAAIAELYAGKYLNADGWTGGNRQCRILGADIEGLQGRNSPNIQRKVTLQLEGEQRPLVVNKTEYGKLAASWGRDPFKWVGKFIFVAVVDKQVGRDVRKGFVLSPVTP